MSKPKLQKPRGMQDLLPLDQKSLSHISETFISVCRRAGVDKISTPILESTELFNRAVGEQTEVVSKEMYTLQDKSNNSLTLKPESTAGVVRAYIENGMASLPKPVNLYYIDPHFRYERPQSGRFRQHHQMGLEIFGDPYPSCDVHAICLGSRVLGNLGIKHTVAINSIGSADDRNRYLEVLRKYFEPYKSDLPEINLSQLEHNPLRILDTKDEKVKHIVEDAPHILDYLDKDSSSRFHNILEMLEGCGVGYELNTRLVRGLDYYNDTVFEYISARDEARDSLGGGGRYDGLVSEMGGVATPAVGFGIGMERIKMELDAIKYIPKEEKLEVFVVAIGKEASGYAEIIREKLLDAGIRVDANFTKKSISDQLAIAASKEAIYAVIVGAREAQQKEAIIKDMHSGNQHTEGQDSIVSSLLKALKG